MAKPSGIPFIRVTVVGMGNCGKTGLVNAFVNNHCPIQYIETDDPTLYYKLINLPAEDDTEGLGVLMEIEDTYSSARGDGCDIYGDQRDVKPFLDMSRLDFDPSKRRKSTKKQNIPLGPYEAPKMKLVGNRLVRPKYAPLTKGRMGFLIVFDANNEKSYEEALKLHIMLQEDITKKGIKLKPIIYLVANKIDKEPNSEEFAKITVSAQIYSQKQMIRFWEISALQYFHVKKMFREMCKSIMGNQSLWLIDDPDDGSGASEGGGPLSGGCTLQ